jgi:hypothetical protein
MSRYISSENDKYEDSGKINTFSIIGNPQKRSLNIKNNFHSRCDALHVNNLDISKNYFIHFTMDNSMTARRSLFSNN